jgi:hypothetical protein
MQYLWYVAPTLCSKTGAVKSFSSSDLAIADGADNMSLPRFRGVSSGWS